MTAALQLPPVEQMEIDDTRPTSRETLNVAREVLFARPYEPPTARP